MLVFGGVPGSFNQNKFHLRKSTLTKILGGGKRTSPGGMGPLPKPGALGSPVGGMEGVTVLGGPVRAGGGEGFFLMAKTGSV